MRAEACRARLWQQLAGCARRRLPCGPVLLMLLPLRPAAAPASCVRLQLVDLFRSYFEGALNENSVKRNFVLIYELLEETMDFGFPQLTGGREPGAAALVWTHGG